MPQVKEDESIRMIIGTLAGMLLICLVYGAYVLGTHDMQVIIGTPCKN